MPEKFYLTTAIDYPNSRPHIGTAFEKIGADVQARYRRQQGWQVFFLMGNDENTIKVVERAEQLGLEPKRYVDDMARQFREVWAALDISYDDFIQTSEERHRLGCQKFITRVCEAGDIYKKNYEALYCEGCEEFKTESQLSPERRCPNHPNRPLKHVEEENYFFRLSKYGDRLLALFDERPDFIRPETRRNEILSLVRSGLEDISISRRDFTWGIDVPWDSEHKIYVWFDALLNYITGIGYGTDETLFQRFWPADVHFIGKDITRFHCALWPAMLMSAGVELPRQVFAHGFVYVKNEATDEVQKISKSLGNVIEPMDIVREFSGDAFRYYFMRECPFGGDGEFSFARFAASYNADLANNLGNLFSRTVSMALRYFDGRLPGSRDMSPDEVFAGLDVPATVAAIQADIEACRYSSALEAIWRQFLDRANRYIEERKPWLLANEQKPEFDREACARVLANLAEAVRVAGILVRPFLPRAAERIYAGFNFPAPFEQAAFDEIARRPPLAEDLRVTAELTADGKVEPLFPKIEPAKAGTLNIPPVSTGARHEPQEHDAPITSPEVTIGASGHQLSPASIDGPDIFDKVRIPPALDDYLRDTNPWWEGKPGRVLPEYRRWAFDVLLRKLDSGIAPAVVLRGPRQVGKTTLQEQAIQYLLTERDVHANRIFRVQFDEIPSIVGLKHPILAVIRWYENRILGQTLNEAAQSGKPAYVFLDEVQNLSDWAPQLKALVDHHTLRVVVTGSSALRIEAGRDSLAGRVTPLELGTLLLREIAGVRFNEQIAPQLPTNGLHDLLALDFWRGVAAQGQRRNEVRDRAFREFSLRGGYPVAHAHAETPWPEIADVLNETVIRRVIQHDLRIGERGRKRDPQLLEEAFRLACRHAGQSPSQALWVSQLREVLQANLGWQRILSYLRFLDEALLIKLIHPLELRLKRRKGNFKICLIDPGLRASWLEEVVPLDTTGLEASPHLADLAGHLAESVVGAFFANIPNLDVAHFPERPTEPEVDFILTVGEKRIPVEVKYRRRIDPLRDTIGLRSFLEKSHYNAPFGVLITLTDNVSVPDPRVVAISLPSLLLMR